MLAHRNIDKLNRLKQATSKLIINGLLFIIVSSAIIPALSAIPVNAASSPSYKYFNNGADIGATGGQFGSNTAKISQNPAGSNTYTGSVQVTVTYNDSFWNWVPLLDIGKQTVTCKAGVRITVNSDKATGSISTPAELNNPGPSFVAPESTHISDCSAAQAAHITDFNQSSISISGSASDNGQITNLSENDDTRQLSVTIYSNKPASELPSVVTATLSQNDSKVATENLTFTNTSFATSNQVFFKNIPPALYKVCITPVSTFNFDQCQTVTKKYGVVPSVVFGSFETISNKEGKLIEVTVDIQMSNGSKNGSYGPFNITLSTVDGSGSAHAIGTAQTNSQTIDTVDGSGSSVGVVANFDAVEPGSYRVCIINTTFCSDFTKAINMKSSVKITVPSDKSDQFYNLKTAAAGTCAVDGIGWIVCPVVNFLAKIADSAFTFLSDNFLSTNVKIFDTTSPTYSAWVIMRNIANVAFVIAFLIIIFSQLTGAGITNYGVKKLLPRIVVAAILVNLSYFICQIAVDLSNILGYSLKNLLAGLAPISSGGTAGFWSGGTWADIAGGILAGAVGIGIIWASLAALVPILLAAVVALVMILFILIARQALIILLIVISPLAFVAFLLPNTDQWFKKWQQTFTAMLMLFPIIALVYGVSSLASNVLSQTFGSGDASLQKSLGQIAAAAVMVLPLFAVPTLLKKSLDGVGNIGATLNGLSGKLSKGTSNAVGNSRLMQYKKSKDAQKSAMIQSGNYRTTGRFSRFNPNNLRSGLHKRFNESGVSGEYGNRELTRGFSVADAADAEVMKNANSRMDNMDFNGVPLSQAQTMQIALGQDVTDEAGNTLKTADKFDVNMRRSAIQKASKIATVSDAQKLVDRASSMETAIERKTVVSSLAGSSALAKAPYLSGKNFGYITSGFKPEDAEADENGYKHNMIKDVDENNNPITRLMTLSEYSAAQTIRDGKIDAEALASGDANSTKMLLKVAQGSVDGTAEKQLLKAAYTTLNSPESRLKEKIVAGSDKDKNIQEMGRL
jgi:hypothetical protein